MTVAQGTPRTDRHVATAYVEWRSPGEWVKADFCRELERENAALSAQVVELQKDAERYRWWRTNRLTETDEACELINSFDATDEASWDAAIDAAKASSS